MPREMTNLEALNFCYDLVSDLPNNHPRKQDVLARLNNMRNKDVFVHWSKELIIQCLKDFKKEKGRAPTTTDLLTPGMPHPATIKKHCDMSAPLFLKQLFPELRNTSKTKIYNQYGFNCKQDWLDCFVEQFNKHTIATSREYNRIKDKGTPQWETIAKHCDLPISWSKLMSTAGVKYKGKIETTHINKVNSYSPSFAKFESLNQERAQLNKELFDILNKRSTF